MNLKNSQNSSMIKFFVIFLALCPPESIQLDLIDEFSTITATCVYSLHSRTNYTCNVVNTNVLNKTDVLNITGNHLEGYSDVNVQSVDFRTTNNIRYLNGEMFEKFDNLKYFYFIDQGLMEISATAFKVCPNLEELIFGLDSQLTALPPQMLQNCGNLKIFIAVMHNLMEIPADLFGSTSNLEEFYVSYNQLTSLPENLLQNMQKLRIFDVSNNLLTKLSPDLLKNSQNLEEVYISSNNFVDQQKVTSALTGLTNLRILWLNNNNFTNFDFNFFEQFTKLEELAIGTSKGPRLTEISWQSLPSSLIEMIIEGIGENIPENGFDRLVNLISLSLSGSGINNLHKDTFTSLRNLIELYIQNTNIKILQPELFISQINLSNLNLNDNKIEELPAGIFVPLVNIGTGNTLQGIRMDYNNIQRLNANSFGQHPHLRYISINTNKINEIERGIFSKFHPNMTTVNLRSNVCINRLFSDVTNLDENENLLWCFNNWEGITTTTTKTTTVPSLPTIPGGCGNVFKKFEIFVIIVVGFFCYIW